LRLLGRFGRRIRFAGLVPREPDEREWLNALRTLPANPGDPYDVVLAWDVLDRLAPTERPAVVERISQVTAARARLYVVVDASGATARAPLSFSLTERYRVTQVPVGPPEPAHAQLLPAQVERTLTPFEVVHAFTLRGGLREYVAIKRAG
jgi:hypothetical protein